MISSLHEAMSSQMTDLTRDGKCTGCGECCSNLLPLSKSEICRIRAYIKKHGIKEQEHFIIGMAEKPKADMTCPFMKLGGNKRCVIYDVRPEICRAFTCRGTKMTKELLREERRAVLMRETFFGK